MLQGWINKIWAVLFCLAMVLSTSLHGYRDLLQQHKAELLAVIDHIEEVEQQLQEYSAPYDQAEENRKLLEKQEAEIDHMQEIIAMVRWQFNR